LYWQPVCEHAVCDVAQALSDIFPVKTIIAASLEPTKNSFDTARGQFDAAYLLREIPDDGALALWVVDVDISYHGYGYLYGVSRGNLAVVSSARTGSVENLRKEACHEVGHLFGLAHCSNTCLMRTSRDLRELEEKPLRLCFSCAAATA
jgi:archaemetzincin